MNYICLRRELTHRAGPVESWAEQSFPESDGGGFARTAAGSVGFECGAILIGAASSIAEPSNLEFSCCLLWGEDSDQARG